MVSSEDEVETKPCETLIWDVETEIQLFYAMANHKPAGITKHFQMACICEKLNNSVNKEITTFEIRKHLESLYELNMLDETEPIPFPNEEITFDLCSIEYGDLIRQKFSKDVMLGYEEEGRISPSSVEPTSLESTSMETTSMELTSVEPSSKATTPRSSSRGSAKDSTPKASRKDSITAMATKNRKESGSSHASTDTPSIKSEKDYDRRRDSRDSNASGTRDSSSSRKSTSQKSKPVNSRVNSVAARDSPVDDDSRRGRRRANTSTPPAVVPAKRRRT